MAKRELGPAGIQVATAVAAVLPEKDFIVGCSGGADSMALALGAHWAVRRSGGRFRAVIIDHGLQPGSDKVARTIRDRLAGRGVAAEVATVAVSGEGGPEAAARDARLEALAAYGQPVLLGHTLDDQAETVLLGLARGSGPRSLAGMAPVRGHFIRPLLGIRRETTREACREAGIEVWQDPHNDEQRFTRVRVRHRVLPILEAELGPGIAEALARTAELCRADADALDALAGSASEDPSALWLAGLDPALRMRAIKAWLVGRGVENLTSDQLNCVDALVTAWRGQKGASVAGGKVIRRDGQLRFVPIAGTTGKN